MRSACIHSPFDPRLRHTAMPAGTSTFARSISMSHTPWPGKAQLRSIASRWPYSATRLRESESATMGSACGGIIQGASSGASCAPAIACQRMAPSSATLRWPSCCIRSTGSGDASIGCAPCAPCAPRGSRPWSTPCPSARARLPGAVAGGSCAQLEPSPRLTIACTSVSKAPPASRLLTVADSTPAAQAPDARARTQRARANRHRPGVVLLSWANSSQLRHHGVRRPGVQACENAARRSRYRQRIRSPMSGRTRSSRCRTAIRPRI